ncbi:MAG: hypothetical protein ACTHJW_11940 [Streptosporangiaceae bacterium]
MRILNSGPAGPAAGGKPVSKRRFRLSRSGRIAVVAGATVGLLATVAGMTAAAVTSGDPSHASAKAAGQVPPAVARTGGQSAHHVRPATPGQALSGQAGAGKAAQKRAAHQRAAHRRATHAAARATVLRTSCRTVAHIGDSTSVDLISHDYLPDPAQRIGARYADVGVRHLKMDASGGRSIVEELPGQLNGYKVASAWRGQGYHGCWVFALGTNDAANIAAGSNIGMMARIDQMMAVAHGEPVLWVNTKTLLTSGPYANVNEQAWDKTLVKALAKYPNLRIFNWSAVAQPSWFLSDGIHYNSPGCAIRAKAIADALARAFPLHGHSASKIVR